MAGEKLGGGYIALSADKQQLVNDLAAAKGGVSSWLSSLQSLIAPIGLSLSAAAIWGTLQDAENSALQAERAFKRLEGVVNATGHAAGFTADELAEMATKLQSEIGYSDEALEDAMSTMLTFKKVTGATFTEAIKLGADMAETFGGGEGGLRGTVMQLGKALEDPVRGMNALRRSGITFTEAEQKKIKALVKSNQLLQAQQLILAAVRGQVGGVAKNAASGPEGQLRIARLKLDDMKEALGAQVLPIQTLLVKGQMLWVQALTETLKVMNQIAPTINSWLNPMEGFSGKMFAATAGALALARSFPMITAAARAAFAAIKLMTISTGWGIVLVAIGAVVAAIWQLVEVGVKSQAFAEGWPAVAQKFRAAWIGAMEVVSSLWQAFSGLVNSILSAMGLSGVQIADTIGGALIQVLDFFASAMIMQAAWAKAFIDNADQLWTAFVAYAQYAFFMLDDMTGGWITTFIEAFKVAVAWVASAFQKLAEFIGGILGAIFESFQKEFEKMGHLGLPEGGFKPLVTESERAREARMRAEEAWAKITAAAAKNARDFMDKAKPPAEAKKKGGAGGGAAPAATAPMPKFKSGIYGFEDYSKMIQEAILKAEDPTEKLVGLTEVGNKISVDSLKALEKIEKKPSMALPVADE